MMVTYIGRACLLLESGVRECSWIRAADAGWYD